MVAVREHGAARAAILDAAARVIIRDGASDFSTRAVAAEAGVNQSLIHYHFGTKEKLMLAVHAEMDARLLARQSNLYESELSIAEKWAQAVAFYRDDLASGYVRLHMELWTIGYSNLAIRAAIQESNAKWRVVVTEGARQAIVDFKLEGVSAEELATLVIDFWLGMEIEHLLGVPEPEGRHWQALATVQGLLERLAPRPQGQSSASSQPPRASQRSSASPSSSASQPSPAADSSSSTDS
jgi:AcrR family transcriptional regulator